MQRFIKELIIKVILFTSFIALSSFLLSACPKNHKKLFERKEEKAQANQEKERAREQAALVKAEEAQQKREAEVKAKEEKVKAEEERIRKEAEEEKAKQEAEAKEEKARVKAEKEEQGAELREHRARLRAEAEKEAYEDKGLEELFDDAKIIGAEEIKKNREISQMKEAQERKRILWANYLAKYPE
ncbi:hypothetical protein AGMMS49921_04680 [Endomicrobiia bacterium]|nr:hypothetical protein AGMMS49921_04680 [Endomicrobiia bacterium]